MRRGSEPLPVPVDGGNNGGEFAGKAESTRFQQILKPDLPERPNEDREFPASERLNDHLVKEDQPTDQNTDINAVDSLDTTDRDFPEYGLSEVRNAGLSNTPPSPRDEARCPCFSRTGF
jgi:hypothetical protein